MKEYIFFCVILLKILIHLLGIPFNTSNYTFIDTKFTNQFKLA